SCGMARCVIPHAWRWFWCCFILWAASLLYSGCGVLERCTRNEDRSGVCIAGAGLAAPGGSDARRNRGRSTGALGPARRNSGTRGTAWRVRAQGGARSCHAARRAPGIVSPADRRPKAAPPTPGAGATLLKPRHFVLVCLLAILDGTRCARWRRRTCSLSNPSCCAQSQHLVTAPAG